MIDSAGTIALLGALAEIFAREEQALNTLDTAIGDGDHGTNILRGMRAAAASAQASLGSGPGAILTGAADAFQSATGGAGGTVFAQIFKGLGHAAGTASILETPMIGAGLEAASAAVQKLGRTAPGSKTMLDALEPAAQVLRESGTVTEALAAAREGAQATRGMAAAVGRARYVADGGVGHMDPGARSVVLILTALIQQLDEDPRSGARR